jgi:hypothetical protein
VTTQETNELAIVKVLTPAVVFAPGGVDEVLGKIKAEVATIDRDISTEQGRAVIRSTAYKIARSKTALDKMGKELGETHFKQWKAITGERARIEEELDKLRESFRKPLTDWEQAEEDRVAGHQRAVDEIVQLGNFDGPVLSQEIQERIDKLMGIPKRDWQEFSQRAADTIQSIHAALEGRLQEAKRQEAERAELERLRAERAAREQAERDARIAAEAAEIARRKAEEIARAAAEEQARKAQEEMERVERERAEERRQAEEAAERAQQEAEMERQRAQAEQERVEREKAAAEQAAREAAERAERAEAERLAAVIEAQRAAREAEQDRILAEAKAKRDAEDARTLAIEAERRRVFEEKTKAEQEAAAREANRRNRAKIHREISDSLGRFVTLEQATMIVDALAHGNIPHVKITY